MGKFAAYNFKLLLDKNSFLFNIENENENLLHIELENYFNFYEPSGERLPINPKLIDVNVPKKSTVILPYFHYCSLLKIMKQDLAISVTGKTIFFYPGRHVVIGL